MLEVSRPPGNLCAGTQSKHDHGSQQPRTPGRVGSLSLGSDSCQAARFANARLCLDSQCEAACFWVRSPSPAFLHLQQQTPTRLFPRRICLLILLASACGFLMMFCEDLKTLDGSQNEGQLGAGASEVALSSLTMGLVPGALEQVGGRRIKRVLSPVAVKGCFYRARDFAQKKCVQLSHLSCMYICHLYI